MQDQPISQLSEASELLSSDLLVVVHDGETQKTTVSTLMNSLSPANPINGLSLSGSGELQLGGTLIEATSIDQNGAPLLLQNGSFISTGSGTSPSLIGESSVKFAWLSDKHAFIAGSFNDNVWDDQIGEGAAIFGFQNKNLGTNSVVFGRDNEVTSNGRDSLVMGNGNRANGTRSFLGGFSSSTNDWSNFVYGNNIDSYAPFGTAFGNRIVIGEETPSGLAESGSNNGGFASFSVGEDILNVSDYGIALGTDHELYGNYAYAFGDKVKIGKSSNYSSGRGCLVDISEGARFNTGIGTSVFINSGSEFSLALGARLNLQSDLDSSNGPKFSFLMGTSSNILPNGEFNFALGTSLNTSSAAGQSRFGFILGSTNNISGDYQVALGVNHTIEGSNSMAVGSGNNIDGEASFALGINNTITSINSGNSTNAFILGRGNKVDASASFAFGTNNTISTGAIKSTDSFALGFGNNAVGRSSFAIGTEASATTDPVSDFGGAYAFGNKAIANGNNSFAYGKYVDAMNGAFVLGSGTEEVPLDSLTDELYTPLVNENPETLAIGFNSDLPTLFVDKSDGIGTSGNVGIGISIPTAKLHVNGNILLENGASVNDIKTVVDTASPSDSTLLTEKGVTDFVQASTNAIKAITQFDFSLGAQANSTIGLLSKSLNNSNNPGAIPTTNPFNPGINNGGSDPYLVIRDSNVKSVRIAFAQAAVGAGTVGENVYIRLELFKIEYSSRVLIDTYNIPLDSSLISINNNLGVDNFQSAFLDNLSTQLGAGDLIGLQFTNISGDSSLINAVGRLYVGLETEMI